jgi:hypothetical protein
MQNNTHPVFGFFAEKKRKKESVGVCMRVQLLKLEREREVDNREK